MGVLSNIEPYGVFRFFEEICGIPHGSSDTKKIGDYLEVCHRQKFEIYTG